MVTIEQGETVNTTGVNARPFQPSNFGDISIISTGTVTPGGRKIFATPDNPVAVHCNSSTGLINVVNVSFNQYTSTSVPN